MDYTKILKRSWDIVWKYKELWFFGMILAFVTTSGLWWIGVLDRDNQPTPLRNSVQISEDYTIYLPGEGVHIDFTDPDGVTLYVEGMDDLRELRNLGPITIDGVPVEVWTLIIIGLVWIAGLIITSIVARYVSGAALIGTVNECEDRGEKPGFKQGLRLGFSRYAWRIFWVDVLVFLLVLFAIVVLTLLVLVPLLLLATGSVVGEIVGIVTASGFFFIGLVLLLFGMTIISLFVQVIRRACVQDDIGVFAGIRRGVTTVLQHPAEMIVIWLIWMGVRLAWTVVSIPLFLLLFPLIIAMVIIGALLAAVPALITVGLSSLFLSGVLPWILGGLVGLPIFILVVAAPMAFLSGLVEIYKSNLWTLSYRELRPLEISVSQPTSETSVAGSSSRIDDAMASPS